MNTESRLQETEENIQTDCKQTENVRKKILIVDDDRNILKMLKTALTGKFDVTPMVNGVLVERFLEKRTVDLIILDYEMPIITGAEVFKRLKENPKAQNIPVCFLTGVSENSKIDEIMKLKPQGFLVKPVKIDVLISTINDLTSH